MIIHGKVGNKIYSQPAELSEPLRPLLKKENTNTGDKLKWEDKHTTTFNKIKTQISKNNRKQTLRCRQRYTSQMRCQQTWSRRIIRANNK